MPKLPVLKTVGLSYSTLIDHFPFFIGIIAGWASVVFAVRTGLTWLSVGLGPPNQLAGTPHLVPALPAALFIMCASSLAAVAVAVTWHRFILLHERPGGAFDVRIVSFFRYLLRGVVLMGTYLAIVFALSLVPRAFVDSSSSRLVWLLTALGMLGFVVGVLLLFGRLSLSYPAAAIDEIRMTFSTSWKFTANNSWRFLLGSVLVIIPVSLVNVLVHSALDRMGSNTVASTLLNVAADVMFLFITTALAAGFLSFAYRHLVEERGNPHSIGPSPDSKLKRD